MFQNFLSNCTNYFSWVHFYFSLKTFAICRLGLRKISISRCEDAPLFWDHLELPAVECSAASVHWRLAWSHTNHTHTPPALVLLSCILLFFSSGDWPQKHVVTSAMLTLSDWKTLSPFWSCFNRNIFRFLQSHLQNIQAFLLCQVVLFSLTTLFTSWKLLTLVIYWPRSSSSSFGRRK